MTMAAPSPIFDRALFTSRQGGASLDESSMQRGLDILMAHDKSLIEFLKDLSLDGLWMWDLETPDRGWMSPRIWKLLGYEPPDSADHTARWRMLLHPDMDKNTLARFDAFCANPDHLFDEIFQLRHRDGSSVWLHSRGIAIRDPGGRAVRLLGAHNDITALKRVENALLRGKADLTALLAKSSEANAWLEMAEQISRIGHWRYNVADQTLIWSNELYRIHGVTCETYSPTIESAVGFSHPDDFDRVQSIITGAIVDAQPFEFSTRVISADGDLRHVNCRGVTRPAADGKVGMIVGVMADVTEQRQTEQALRDANARLQQLVNVDSLTGLANRRRFDQGLSQEWRRAARERTPLSLVLVDIDRFKEFNDRYGHLAGDDCLRRVAGVLAEHCRRSGDLVARYGGEEMVLLLPTTTPAGAEIVARACRSAIAGLEIRHDGNLGCGGTVTASFGVATAMPAVESDIPDWTDLVAEADRQLYEAKRTGRNKVMTQAIAASVGAAPLAGNEAARLAALKRYEAAGVTCRTQEMDGIARLAATLTGSPTAMVSFIGRTDQQFAGTFNLPGIDSISRDVSLCTHTMLGDEPMVVADASRDARFKENPLVTGGAAFRYYAGAPIISQSTGHKLGALCVVDTVPHERTGAAERAILSDLAETVAALIEDSLKSRGG